MQLKGIEKEDVFTTIHYDLTWAVGWEQILSFIEVIIKTDFEKGGIQSVEVGMIAGAESVDVTKDLEEHGNRIRDTEFSKKESGYIVIAGYSSIMRVPMRIAIWNQLDHFMLQLVNDTAIEKFGEHVFDKYVDSIEILETDKDISGGRACSINEDNPNYDLLAGDSLDFSLTFVPMVIGREVTLKVGFSNPKKSN